MSEQLDLKDPNAELSECCQAEVIAIGTTTDRVFKFCEKCGKTLGKEVVTYGN